MTVSVFARVFSLTRPAARKELRGTFGEHLERCVRAADLSVTEVADRLGIKRPNIYKIFRGDVPLHFVDAYLLPKAVLLPLLEDLAASVGHTVLPAELEDVPADYDHAESLGDYVRELHEAINARVTAEADGQLTVDEIDAMLVETADAREALRLHEHVLKKMRAERGGVITSLLSRIRGAS